jgi:ABC-type nitrate/sulfonate/bicarbonate transport system substrate-binding protein
MCHNRVIYGHIRCLSGRANIKTKYMVIIIVIIELVAAMGIVVLSGIDNDNVHKDVSIIARVNTNGSGIYLADGYDADDFITIEDDGTVIYHADAWGGKVFGTPGSSSIQHIQLMTIVIDDMELNFEKYVGGDLNTDTVYYVDSISNYTAAINSKDILDGGILWEPQYSMIIDSSYFVGMATTNVLFPNHTCCLIAGYESFLTSHPEETIRFLAAYIEAVDFINLAKTDTSSEEYKELVQICLNSTTGLTEEVIEEALTNVTYVYSDQAGTADFRSLKTDMSSLVTNLSGLGKLSYSMSDLGFSSTDEFVDAFLDSSYLANALNQSEYEGSSYTITVAAIQGDIHQIALQVAIQKGFFEDYGISINLKSNFQNGGAVALDLLSGQSDIGFLGAPPLTISTINGKYITNITEG